ncbi:hypothetical protein ACWDUK_30775, partial [Streptomyces cellulosae]
DQNLLDNYHKSERRGRSAPLNMVITETGAASAPAFRVPGHPSQPPPPVLFGTPNGGRYVGNDWATCENFLLLHRHFRR